MKALPFLQLYNSTLVCLSQVPSVTFLIFYLSFFKYHV
nr:MAG TPA: hypothetical protein [Caudoviricetes sp.]